MTHTPRMPDDDLFASLEPWQARLFGAACANRLAGLIDAFGTAAERRAFHAGLDAVWSGRGDPPPETVAALLRRVSALVDPENPSLGAEFLIVVGYALRADAGRAADQASERWEYVGEHLEGDWARREARYQRRDLAVLAGQGPEPNLGRSGSERAEAGPAPAVTGSSETGTTQPVRFGPGPTRPRDPSRAVELLHRPFRDADELTAALPLLAEAWGEQLNPVAPLPPEPSPRVRHATCVHPPPAAPNPKAAVPDAALDAALIGAVLVAPGDTCPIGPAGVPVPPFRPGDVLTVSAEFMPHVVVGVSEYEVVVQPLAGGRRVAFARGGGGSTWNPYVLRPGPDKLWVGDRCQVGIATITGYVLRTQAAALHLLPFGRTASGGLADETVPLDPYAPLAGVELVLQHRPYPFLVPGDVVEDAAGVLLIFQPPFLFTRPSGEGGIVPRWPLILRERQWTPTGIPQPVIATRHGCHDDLLDGWELQSGAELPADREHESWFCWPDGR
jgi:hypothetical protein